MGLAWGGLGLVWGVVLGLMTWFRGGGSWKGGKLHCDNKMLLLALVFLAHPRDSRPRRQRADVYDTCKTHGHVKRFRDFRRFSPCLPRFKTLASSSITRQLLFSNFSEP